MAAVIFGIGALVVLSILSTSKEQRDEARERMKPIGRALLPFVIAAWAFIIWAVWWNGGNR